MNTHTQHPVPWLTVVIPVLDEAGVIDELLGHLAPMRTRGCEVILVDGGSQDGTPQRAGGGVDRIINSERGRARQMNAGAAVARGQALWFLHADTRIPLDGDQRIRDALKTRAWGRFDVRLSGEHP
ncbi:MAG: glycosyltransferase, partial [Thioalkalivibrio sp.]